MTRLVILRPADGASATLAKARAAGLEAETVPLFTIEKVEWSAPEPSRFDGLLLTSANAVTYGGEQLQHYRGLRTFAVGDATAEKARSAGFDIAATGDAGIDRLLGSIDPDLKLLHACGEDRRSPAQARQEVTSVVVYRAAPTPKPSVVELLPATFLVHSPRTAKRLSELVDDRASSRILAISKAAADAVGCGWMSIDVAPQPTDDALLVLAAGLCNNSDRK